MKYITILLVVLGITYAGLSFAIEMQKKIETLSSTMNTQSKRQDDLWRYSAFTRCEDKGGQVRAGLYTFSQCIVKDKIYSLDKDYNWLYDEPTYSEYL